MFRPVQYLGGKWRLLQEIERAVGEVVGTARPAVLDLFAGTGVVSAYLARRRPVFASDVQEYSRVLTQALTSPEAIDLDCWLTRAREIANDWSTRFGLADLLAYEAEILGDEHDLSGELAFMLDFGSIEARSWEEHDVNLSSKLRPLLSSVETLPTLFRYYGGVYFSYTQALHLDALLRSARMLPKMQGQTAIAALLGVASDISTSVGGHFAQPVRARYGDGRLKLNVLQGVRQVRRREALSDAGDWGEKYNAIDSTVFPVVAARQDFRAALADIPESVGCIYADPPYTREHYSRFYHVLETISLGDNPGLSRTTRGTGLLPSRGLYRIERHQSPFSIVSEAPGAFAQIFAAAKDLNIPVVLSYSPVSTSSKPRARVIGLEDLTSIAGQYFPKVEVLPLEGVVHSRLNARHLNVAAPLDAEVLVVAEP